MKNKLLIATIICSIFSCQQKENSTNESLKYYKLVRQLTPSQKYYIYDYARFGAMAFSSDIGGTEIFKVEEEFSEGKGINISQYSIGHWINQDTLLVYDFKSKLKQPIDTFPETVNHKQVADFVLKIEKYKTNSGGRNPLNFDSLSIKSDSVKIHGIKNKSFKAIAIFPKGNITINEESGTLKRLDIQVISKNMNFVRKEENGSIVNGKAGIGTTIFEFTPIKKIKINSIDSIGIFKGVK